MNNEQLHKLFSRARSTKTDTSRVEYGFETRLLARIRAGRQADVPWFAFAWRLMPVFAAIVVVLGVWNYADIASDAADLRTVITDESDEALLASYLAGESR